MPRRPRAEKPRDKGRAATAVEPIAIVGVGCRFPGGIRDLHSFGTLLAAGSDVLQDVPGDRWSRDLWSSEPGRRCAVSNHVGAFLDDIDRFDAAYFGISPREACYLDPQQRILMEVAWEAMSDSGRSRDSWRGSRTAVYVGMLANDYNLLHARTLGMGGIGPHYASGMEFSFAAGRLAYAFDLHGPVAAVNSACSSSLLAVHQACQSLRAGECDTAIAGGIGLLIGPELSIFLSSVGAVSPTGRCRPFDAAADGLVRGEGCGVVVLKPLATAVRDGDAIYAVIRGSAVTHDGSSMGLTAPNAAAQDAMLRGALASAGLEPDGVDYVEAHGTGTPLGDHIELGTLAAVYGVRRGTAARLLVGSLKAVFGHMDAAAGIAGLLKATWVATTGRVPAQPHFHTPNPAVDWENGGISVPTSTVDLNHADRPVRAGVSAFGLSGTNVHMIVEAPSSTAGQATPGPGPYLLLTSAGRADGLTEQVAQMRTLVRHAGDQLDDLVASAATRSTFETHRYAVVGATTDELLTALGDPEDPPDGAYTGLVPEPDDAATPVFVFSGQGGQWPGMAMDLYETDPVVRATLDECDALVRAEASWSLLDELRRERDDGWERSDLAQPAIFAVQVAVARWLTERGVTPVAVVGHSMGEVAAAHVAGYLTLGEAVQVIVRRAGLLHETAGTGQMYAVQGNPTTVRELLAEHAPRTTVAAVNGPTSVVISGPTGEVDAAATALTANGLRCRLLRVDAASHSPLVAHCGPLLREATASLNPAPPAMRLVSSVEPQADEVRPDASYWARNITEPVQLWPAVDRLLAEEDRVLIEVGPHPVLVGSLTDAIAHRGREGAALGTLRRDQPGAVALHRTLAQLYVAGVPVDWERVTGRPHRHRSLPRPSWAGERYWLPGVERGVQASASTPVQIRLSLLDANGQVTAEMLARPVEEGTPASRPAAAAIPVYAAPVAAAPVPGAPVAAVSVAAVPVAAVSVAAVPTTAVPSVTAPPVPVAGAHDGLTDRVEGVVRRVLGVSDDRRLVRRRGLFEQGLDSLTAAELRLRLEAEFGTKLPAPIVFEHPTISALAAYLAKMGVSAPPAPPAPPVAADSAAAGSTATATATPTAATSAVAAVIPVAVAPAEAADDDAIAVIGVACRLPGANSPDELWTLLSDGRTTVGEPPDGRRDDPIWAEAGVDIPSRSCYLDDVAGFDAPFFRISPREAKSLDPQQRLFLEVAWEALEDAGCPARALAGQPVGVYVGLEAADYQQLLTRDMGNVNLYYGTGASFAAVSGRLSYFLGLHGPSLVVDTACSASLTAVHLACQGLRAGDCSIAVVGGAHVMIAPTLLVAMTESGALAADGWCKTFDEAADGYGCGEGSAALVLKPLSAARRDNDRVYAVIRGSAVNQDGASGGFTVPNATAQAALIRKALDRAGWAPGEVDYVEAHGTGTPLGDPIEVDALAEAYGPGRDADRPLLIGSLKPNVGHLAAAAGVVGLLKVVLSLHRGQIPRHLVDRPSSRIDWNRLPVRIPTENHRWPEQGRPARAGVSSFGLTGTNVHVLVEAVPSTVVGPPEPARDGLPLVLPVTATDPAALRASAGRLGARLRSASAEELADIVVTATHRRSWLDHRLVAVGADADELAEALEQFAASKVSPRVRHGEVTGDEANEATFWYGDALPSELLRDALLAVPEYERVFTECLDQLAACVAADRGGLPSEPGDDLRAAYVFCYQVAATRLWAELGVRPHRTAGEGAGRATAAWARGTLSMTDALQMLVGQDDATLPPEEPAFATEPMIPVLLDEPAASEAQPSSAAGASPLLRMALRTAELFVAGYLPAAPVPARPPVSLPGYPWQHRAYWYHETPDEPGAGPVPWIVSGPGPDGLRAEAAQLERFVRAHPKLRPTDIGAALAARPHQPDRAVITAGSRSTLLSGLEALSRSQHTPDVVAGVVSGGPVGVVMVFPGAGAQWVGMGVGLLECSPVFAAKLVECDAVLRPLTGWSVVEVLRGGVGAPELSRVDVVQPTLFAVMVALAQVWVSVGVRPAAVLGHSQGEIAAAHVAGALSLVDAARIVALRSRSLVELSGLGAMASVAASGEVTASLVAGVAGLSVAGVNGPSATLVAGDPPAVESLLAVCEQRGIRARRIPVDYASHCPHVEQVREQILDALAGITAHPGGVPICSTVTGELIDPTELTADYWYRNLRQPVQFETATRTLLQHGHTLFLEVSPHPVLTIGLQDTAQDAGTQAVVLETLRRDDGGHHRLVNAFAEAYVHGVDIDWHSLFPQSTDAVDLPAPAAGATTYHSALPSAEALFWQALDGGDTDKLSTLLEVDSQDGRATVEAVASLLSSWRVRHRQRTLLDSWRYHIAWRPVTQPPVPEVSGTWLVVAPADEPALSWTTGCVQALREHDVEVRQILVDGDKADRAVLTDQIRAVLDNGPALAGVVSLLALDEAPHPVHGTVQRGLAATVALVQALDDVGVEAPRWFLTCGAVSTEESDVVRSPLQAQVLGLSRVSGLDDPRRWGGQIDLPTEADEQTRRWLCAALAGIGDEDQLAIRASGILVRRLIRAPLADRSPATSWRPRGTVLVTGGTGALGGHVARWVAREGASRVILLSRGGTAAPAAGKLSQELEGLGTTVTTVACDITDRDAVSRVLAEIPQEHPLRAVFHLAGVVGRRSAVTDIDLADFVEVLEPKVTGAMNLDDLIGDTPLDAFVLFSSNAGVWGSSEQGPYAAANALLDALAQRRRAAGRVATSVAWGAWAGDGRSSDAQSARFLARRGVREMPVDDAMAALHHAIDHDETFVAVADVDWGLFAQSFAATRPRPLLAELTQEQGHSGPASPPPDAGEVRAGLTARLTSLPRLAGERFMLQLVSGEVARVLQYDSTQQVEAARAFKELGFDSLTAVELRNRLNGATGLRLPSTLVFDHPTPLALAGYLFSELLPQPQDADRDPGPDPEPAPSNEHTGPIESMDVAELVRLAHGNDA